MSAKASSSKSTGAEAEPAPTASPPASTLRKRHEPKESDAPGSEGTAAASPSPPAPTTATAAVRRTALTADDTPYTLKITRKTVLLSLALAAAAMLLLLAAFVGLQLVMVDDMDVHRTVARLNSAGLGQEWFPVWLGNFVVDSLTAVHQEVEPVPRRGGAGGGGGIDDAAVGGRPPVPGRKPNAPAPPPPRVNSGTSAHTSAVSDSAAGSGAGAAAGPALHCYTLEEYSENFLQLGTRTKKAAQFSCGTRVADLRSEERADVLAACATPASRTSTTPPSHFPTLRVVLTAAEVRRHREVQPVNTVTQRIPLARVNDDYCDCMDGTDELLTNACSMSGPLTPAGGARWKPYLVSTQLLRLYDTPDALEQADLESRGFPLTPRKRGDVGDRLYVSQGPVLPTVCSCGTVRQLVAPSLVGDGVVDCCDAADEAAAPQHGAAPTNNPPHVQAALDRLMAAERAATLQSWRRRQAAVAHHLSQSRPARYADALSPFHTSARALLVDKGYYALFTAEEVQQERLAAATALHDLYARGHAIQRKRVQKGWERLGQSLMENRTQLQRDLAAVTEELTALERGVREQMEAARTQNPIEAGVPMDVLQRHEQLVHAYQGMQMEVQHASITAVHHAYGDHFEYYPLQRRVLSIAAEKVVDSTTPPHLYAAAAQERARRLISLSQLEAMVAHAQRSGQGVPPLHTDNISVSFYGLEIARHTLAAQRFDAAEAPAVARQLGLLGRGPDAMAAFTPRVFDNITDPFLRAPVLPIGSWQPYQTLRDGSIFHLADPAGGVHLAERAEVAAASSLFRGGGRLQLPLRHPEAPRSVTVDSESTKAQSLKEKIKAAADGHKPTEKKVEIPYHFHTPNVFAVGRFIGQVRCEADAVPRRGTAGDAAAGPAERVVEAYTTYLCDAKDRVLYWGRNGKCVHEVVIGTPSACTAWGLKRAKEAVAALTRQPPSSGAAA